MIVFNITRGVVTFQLAAPQRAAAPNAWKGRAQTRGAIQTVTVPSHQQVDLKARYGVTSANDHPELLQLLRHGHLKEIQPPASPAPPVADPVTAAVAEVAAEVAVHELPRDPSPLADSVPPPPEATPTATESLSTVPAVDSAPGAPSESEPTMPSAPPAEAPAEAALAEEPAPHDPMVVDVPTVFSRMQAVGLLEPPPATPEPAPLSAPIPALTEAPADAALAEEPAPAQHEPAAPPPGQLPDNICPLCKGEFKSKKAVRAHLHTCPERHAKPEGGASP
jgi:hypothetical protein